MDRNLIQIAVRSPLRRLFTYEVESPLMQGTRVRVPFGKRDVLGVVWGPTHEAPEGLKKVSMVLDEAPVFSAGDLQFYQKASEYYGISLGELLGMSVPKKVAEGKPLKRFDPKIFHFNLVELSENQSAVVERVLATSGFSQHLILGETGSGKTEVYLKMFERIVQAGGQCLLLVPEISLTPQFQERMRERLGTSVSVFHSQLKESLREEAFARALSGQPDIFLGTRSALFLPLKNLRMIVVDEEHDSSYKQNERGSYHARDLAIWKSQLSQIPVVLGSATPSLETYERMRSQSQMIHRLEPYYKSPSISQRVVDLKSQFREGEKAFISEALHEALIRNLENENQSLVFLNRRGSASQRLCVSCGATASCKNCSTTLTVHRDKGAAICHWCGFQERLNSPCKTCGAKEFFEGGIGTKEVEVQLKSRFPDARIARLDRDESESLQQLSSVIERFARGEIDILVGTQMISKGIDIPKLSVVGVILADQGWGIPDFRGLEKSFQLFKQLRGRAGRRGQSTEFIIQTFQAQHPLFQLLDGGASFEDFAATELEIRRVADLPPFSRLALWTLSHKVEAEAERSAQVLKSELDRMGANFGIQSIGPTPAPLSRWKGYFRYQVLTKSRPQAPMTALITAVLDALETKPLKAKVKLDRDPYHFL